MKTTALLTSVAALLVAPLSASAQLYSVQVIGPINGGYTYARALNNAGQVLGSFGGQLQELYLSGGGNLSFPGDLGGLFPLGLGLDDAGNFVGQYLHNGNYHAYVSIGGVVTDLGALGGAHFSAALDLNNSGLIIGHTSTDTSAHRAFLYSNGIMSDLGTLGGNESAAEAINEVGAIAGYSSTASGSNHGFVYSGGLMSDLGTLGGNESYGVDINNLGQAVGNSTYDPASNVNTHAFLYNLGAIHDLGALAGGADSWASAINDAGFIVGSSRTATSVHAFISNGQTMTDLNSLVDFGNTGLQYLSSARDINDLGQITGEAVNAQGLTVAYVLTPFTAVPEPAAYSWAGILILILIAFGRRIRVRQSLPNAA